MTNFMENSEVKGDPERALVLIPTVLLNSARYVNFGTDPFGSLMANKYM
jgi:hypothetical protein